MTRHLFPILLPLILLTSCTQSEKEVPSSPSRSPARPAVSSVPPVPIPGHRFIVTGDFDGDGRRDTMAEHLVDRATGLETYRHLENEDYEATLERLMRERPRCFIASTDPRIDTIPVTKDYPALGLAFMKNEGDLDGNGTDELSWVWDPADMSAVNSCVVMTLTPKGWREFLSFEIREWQIPQLPGEAKEYGMFGMRDAAYGEHDDSVETIIRRTLEVFGFITPIRPGLVRVRTFSGIDTDSIAIAESITALVRLPDGPGAPTRVGWSTDEIVPLEISGIED